jgi:ribonuclease P protein component
MEYSFGKAYKLCSVKRIDSLFSEGKRVKAYPISIVYQETDAEMEHPFQVVFSVPKKRMKHAHDRNYVKRCFREILRLNKSQLENHLTMCGKKINFALIYQLNERIPYQELEQKLIDAITKLIIEIKHEK